MDNFSWLAVAVGAIAFYFLGALWYSFLFRKPWLADMGIDPNVDRQAPMAGMLVASGVSALAVAFVIEFIVRDAGIGYGLCRGSLVGVAMAAAIGQCAFYDTRPRRLGLINGAYPLIGAVIVGAISAAL
jgi:membrane protease YdiL (CAAX protease family)